MTTMSTDISLLAMSLSKFQGKCPAIVKDKQAHRYKYADLASIAKAISTVLMENELSVSQFFTEERGECFITTLLMHSSGQWIKSIIKVAHHDEIQKLGSEITYLRRYALSSILGIAAEDDDDGAQANQTERKESVKTVKNKTINTEQVKKINELLKEVNDEEYFKQFSAFLKIDSVDEIDFENYERTLRILEKKIRMNNEGKNAAASMERMA